MVGNLLLASAKTILSFLSGSAALIADALHSFSDLLVSVLVLAGLKFNKKKIEALVTLIVGIAIIFVAVGFAIELFFKDPVLIKNIVWAVSGQIIIITATYILYKYKTTIGEEENSESLIADGAHTKSDMLSSIGVLVSLIGTLIGLNLDKAAAFVIFFLILYQSLETIWNAICLFRGSLQYIDQFNNIWLSKIKENTTKFWQKVVLNKKRSLITFSACIIIIYCIPGFYVVEQNENGVKTIFGVTQEKVIEPGFHFDPLYLFSTLELINISEIRNMEYGFRYNDPSSDDIMISQFETFHNSRKYHAVATEEDQLTGDGSIIKLSLIVEYRVENPIDYLKKCDNPEEILRVETGSQLQKVIGSLELFDVLNKKRASIEQMVLDNINKSIEDFETGLIVEKILIVSITPHLRTVYMFRTVQDEELYKETLIYDAQAVKARQLPYYRGLSYEKIAMAEAEAKSIILKAIRESTEYKLLERQYILNKDALLYRLELDSRAAILNKAGKILIENKLSDNLIRINQLREEE